MYNNNFPFKNFPKRPLDWKQLWFMSKTLQWGIDCVYSQRTILVGTTSTRNTVLICETILIKNVNTQYCFVVNYNE